MATRKNPAFTLGEAVTIESNLFSSDLKDNYKALLQIENEIGIPRLAKAIGKSTNEISSQIEKVKRKAQKRKR